MRYFVLSLALLAAGIGLTFVEREPQAYTPVVRLRSTDGMFVTFVQHGHLPRSVCNQVIEGFTRVLRQSCSSCIVESADCAAALEGIDRALALGERLPLYTVSADTFRIAMVGPPERVEAECMDVALQMTQQGMRTAVCNLPAIGGRIHQ